MTRRNTSHLSKWLPAIENKEMNKYQKMLLRKWLKMKRRKKKTKRRSKRKMSKKSEPNLKKHRRKRRLSGLALSK